MQDYRHALKNHFERKPYLQNLFMADALLFSIGLLFLLFHEFSILTVNTDIFFALGFWFFWIGIALSFVKKSDINLSIGLGLYAILYFVEFIIACVHANGGYGGYAGFYGFTSLCNMIVASFLLVMTVRESEYYQKYIEQRKALIQLAQSVPKPQAPKVQKFSQGTLRCPECGSFLEQGTVFCTNCGTKIPTGNRCKQCESLLPENTSFCVVCGAKVESAESKENEPKVGTTVTSEGNPEGVEGKKLCPTCGTEIIGNIKFCTKCGSKLG
jgi:RNA polymerase subunit RPABC4/transcription elongation factor Spt4